MPARSPIRLSSGPGRFVAVALLVFLVVAGSATEARGAPSPPSAPVAPQSIGVRLLDVPSAQARDPRSRLYVVDHLAPGAVLHRRIEVTNTTASTAHLTLYSAAATIADGTFLGAAGHTANDLSTWTTVSPATVDVPAGGASSARVTITVPRDAAAGEQYGAVWSEMSSAQGGLTEVNRVGIRLYVSVGAGGAPAPDFAIDSLTAGRTPDGRPIVRAAVHNTGGRALDMHGTLDLAAGPGGTSAGPYAADLGVTLAVGATEAVTIILDKGLPSGPWTARIALRSGLVERVAQATITFPATGSAAATKATPTGSGSARRVVTTAIAGIAAALTAAVALQRWHQRKDQHVS